MSPCPRRNGKKVTRVVSDENPEMSTTVKTDLCKYESVDVPTGE